MTLQFWQFIDNRGKTWRMNAPRFEYGCLPTVPRWQMLLKEGQAMLDLNLPVVVVLLGDKGRKLLAKGVYSSSKDES